jgi:hypothetical protein
MDLKNSETSVPNLDSVSYEPGLCNIIGYDNCRTCYFKLSTIERIQKAEISLKEA